jgi:hypothetical protein
MRLKDPKFAGAILAAASMGACALGCSCPEDFSPGVVFLVMGGGAGGKEGIGGLGGASQPMEGECLAFVEVSPSARGKVYCTGTGNDCFCHGGSTKGRYEITATLDGRTETKQVRVKKEDRCHLKTEYFCMLGDCPPDWP